MSSWDSACDFQIGNFSRDPQKWDPLPISFPYHSHTSKDSYESGMGVVWEWKSHYWGSLEFPLIRWVIWNTDPKIGKFPGFSQVFFSIEKRQQKIALFSDSKVDLLRQKRDKTKTKTYSSWWLKKTEICCLPFFFSPNWGEMIQFGCFSCEMGWFNRQLLFLWSQSWP